jgi:Ca2+-binding RTX toxin-like protein
LGYDFREIQFKQKNMATINGTNGNDSITPSFVSTGVTGGAPSDANDIITPGLGDDTVDGGGGIDRLVLSYSGSTSRIYYSSNSAPAGGVGTIYGTGSSSDSLIFSNVEVYQITGSAFNDEILGGNYNDTLQGGSGDDSIDGGKGSDRLDGGAGVDTVIRDMSAISTGSVVDNTGITITLVDGTVATNFEGINIKLGTGNDIIKPGLGDDTVDGGGGIDRLSVDYSSSTSRIYYSSNSAPAGGVGTIYGTGSSSDSLIFSNVEVYQITGSAFNDEILGGNGNDTLQGGSGDDSIDSGEGSDRLDGGAGIDTVIRDMSAISTGSVVDNTGTSMTLVDGTVANNFEGINIKLGTGNDIIKPGFGDDTVDGGGGIDRLTLNYSSSTSRIYYSSSSAPEGGVGRIYGTGSSSDSLIFSNVEVYQITGSAFNDEILGGNYNDTLQGGGGDDFISGQAGNDILMGGIGNDTQIGGTGSDIYYLENSGDVISETSTAATDIDTVRSFISYTLGANLERLSLQGTSSINASGNTLNNFLNGNTGSNNLAGALGNDTLNGGAGNDTLNGGASRDLLIGGTGGDLYIVDSTSDVVSETSTVTTEIDTVRAYVSYGLSANLERLSLQDTSNINAIGNNQNNLLVGNAGNNILNGQGGKDTLTGNAGNDILVGAAGGDLLTGGTGNDSFNYVTGAAFTTSAVGVDLLTDFARTAGNTDKIKLSSTTFNAGTSFASVGSDALAASSAARITFSFATGHLFYNQNGSVAGFGTGGHFATLSDINGAAISGANTLLTTDFAIAA